jgi:hypothetical protein
MIIIVELTPDTGDIFVRNGGWELYFPSYIFIGSIDYISVNTTRLPECGVAM